MKDGRSSGIITQQGMVLRSLKLLELFKIRFTVMAFNFNTRLGISAASQCGTSNPPHTANASATCF